MRPETVSFTQGAAFGAIVSPTETLALAPPAQLTVKIPSSSESMFSIRRAESWEKSSPCAPSMPISSSTVKTASSAGWAISLLSRIASAMATAMPSSPPSVVPSAET